MHELEAQSFRDGQDFRGNGLVIAESRLRVLGLRTIRGRSSDALAAALGIALPDTTNAAVRLAEGWVVCTEPGCWRTFTTPVQHRALLHAVANLPPAAALASDLSSSLCTFELAGPRARHVIASGCPLDLNPRDFPAGHAARSQLNEIAILIVKTSGAPSFLLTCERPHARAVWDWLARAAGPANMPASETGSMA